MADPFARATNPIDPYRTPGIGGPGFTLNPFDFANPVPQAPSDLPAPEVSPTMTQPVPTTPTLPSYVNPMMPFLGPTAGASVAGSPFMPPGQTASSVGGAAANSPLDLSPPNPGAMSRSPASLGTGGGGAKGASSALQNLSRGVQALQPGVVSPAAAPRPPADVKVPPSEVVNTLMALGITPQMLNPITMGLGRR